MGAINEILFFIQNNDEISLKELEYKFNKNGDKNLSSKIQKLLKELVRDNIIYFDNNKYLSFIPDGDGWCKFTEKRCNPSECDMCKDYKKKCISAETAIYIDILDNIEKDDEIPEDKLIEFYSSPSYDDLIKKINEYNKNLKNN